MLTPDIVLQSRYRIVRKLGEGGMGVVYEAVDLRFNHQVALKETFFTEEALRKQFEREAHLLYKLRHPALARVIDHFTENEGQYLVMDFIEGDDLWEMLQKRKAAFPVEDVLKWADQLLDALDYLHSQEPPVIHRDIKPQNLKVTGRNQIILLDFGLAKGFAGQISRITTSGSIFGYTPNYAPLEQIHGTGTDARSDIYSLAATLYHLITGKVPPDALSRAMALTSEQPDPLKPANEINKQVPTSVADVLHYAMATNPAKRPISAAELRQALNYRTQPQPSTINGLKETTLPPTVTSPAPKQVAKDAQSSPLQQTVVSPSISPPKTEYPATIKQADAWKQPEGGTNAQPEPSFAHSSKPYLWVIGAVVIVLIVGVLLFNSSGEQVSNSNISSAQPSTSPEQSGLSLTGKVKDQSGKGVPNALVTLTEQYGKTTTVRTNAGGMYYFFALVPNEYTIEASTPDLKRSKPKQTVRTTDGTTTLDIIILSP
jgi:serine/threonine protein kinase